MVKIYRISVTKRTKSTNSISGIFHRYLELKKCRPKISKLRTILQDTPYFGPSSATEGGHTLHLFEEKVQASPLELESALRDLKAVHVDTDGKSQKWFMLEPDYHMRALSMMCNFVEENGWKWYSGEILEKETVEAVASQSLPQEVAKQVFDFLCFSGKE